MLHDIQAIMLAVTSVKSPQLFRVQLTIHVAVYVCFFALLHLSFDPCPGLRYACFNQSWSLAALISFVCKCAGLRTQSDSMLQTM